MQLAELFNLRGEKEREKRRKKREGRKEKKRKKKRKKKKEKAKRRRRRRSRRRRKRRRRRRRRRSGPMKRQETDLSFLYFTPIFFVCFPPSLGILMLFLLFAASNCLSSGHEPLSEP